MVFNVYWEPASRFTTFAKDSRPAKNGFGAIIGRNYCFWYLEATKVTFSCEISFGGGGGGGVVLPFWNRSQTNIEVLPQSLIHTHTYIYCMLWACAKEMSICKAKEMSRQGLLALVYSLLWTCESWISRKPLYTGIMKYVCYAKFLLYAIMGWYFLILGVNILLHMLIEQLK